DATWGGVAGGGFGRGRRPRQRSKLARRLAEEQRGHGELLKTSDQVGNGKPVQTFSDLLRRSPCPRCWPRRWSSSCAHRVREATMERRDHTPPQCATSPRTTAATAPAEHTRPTHAPPRRRSI